MGRGVRVCAAVLIAGIGASAFAVESGSPDRNAQWQLALTPYLWIPNVGGTMRFTLPGGGADAAAGPYDYLEHLHFALMLQGEARKGDWSLFADSIYLSFGRHASSISSPAGAPGLGDVQRSAETGLRGLLVQAGGGRTVVRRSWGSVDAIVGVRYLGISATLDASASASPGGGTALNPEIRASGHQNVVNGFAGARGRLSLAGDGRWYVPYYVDVGAGSSRFTWQAISGVAYAAKWGDVSLTYRYLAFYGSGSQLVQTLRFNGPSANVTFRF